MEIPNNNLPIYLQQYNIHIVDGETNEPKGNIQYSTVGAIPSNQIQRRVWNLNLTGKLDPNADIYKIVYDFSNVNDKEKDIITFENDLSGTFRICGHVMDASRIMTYEYSEKESTLTILINRKKWGFRLRKSTLFSYNLNLDDTEVCCDCYRLAGDPKNFKSGKSATLNSGDVCTLPFNTDSGVHGIQLENNGGRLTLTKTFYFRYIYTNWITPPWYRFNNPVSSGIISTTSGSSTLKLSNVSKECSGENETNVTIYYTYNDDGSITVST